MQFAKKEMITTMFIQIRFQIIMHMDNQLAKHCNSEFQVACKIHRSHKINNLKFSMVQYFVSWLSMWAVSVWNQWNGILE
jgi:hypothetical protein